MPCEGFGRRSGQDKHFVILLESDCYFVMQRMASGIEASSSKLGRFPLSDSIVRAGPGNESLNGYQPCLKY